MTTRPTTANVARVARAHLVATDQKARTQVIRPIAEQVPEELLQDMDVAASHVRGLGELGVRELIVCLGLWLAEHKVEGFTSQYERE